MVEGEVKGEVKRQVGVKRVTKGEVKGEVEVERGGGWRVERGSERRGGGGKG